ncbi:hypothetical protein OROHE_002711 [Orobanche hederae]
MKDRSKKTERLFSRIWWPVMTADTTNPSYWFNWRFLLCALWVIVAMVFSALLIWKHEGRMISRNRSSGDHQEAAGCLFKDEIWVTCSKSVHPVWLLAYRIIAFSALLALLLADLTIHGAVKYFFYTDGRIIMTSGHLLWSLFTLGLGSLLSIGGCLCYCHKGKVERERHTCMDADNGSYVPPSLMVMENAARPIQNEGSSHCGEPNCKTAASFWGYALQIIFQMWPYLAVGLLLFPCFGIFALIFRLKQGCVSR